MADASSVIEQTREYFDQVREEYKEQFARAYESGLPNIENVNAIGARFAALHDVWKMLNAAADSKAIDDQFPKENE